MSIDKRWILLLTVAAGAAGGAAYALSCRSNRTAGTRQHKTDLKSWENEGGNLAPAPVAPVAPVAAVRA